MTSRTDTTTNRTYSSLAAVKAFFCAAVLMAAFTAALASCSNSELWDKLPDKASTFINQYYPMSQLQAVTETDGSYHVRLDNGPGITFTSDGSWTAVNGYGLPLPQVMLFDQLPPRLYDYLQESENLNSVFSMERSSTKYVVELLTNTVTYDVATNTLTGTTPT